MILAITGVIAFASEQAKAIEYRDADLWNTSIAALGSVSGDFNIVALDGNNTFTVSSIFNASTQAGGQTFNSVAGYVPGTPIQSGDVAFWFHNSANDTFNITVGLGTLLSSANSGPVALVAQNLNATLIADLQADGVINYRIDNLGGTAITFDYALLRANVPDGGTTVMLLGAGLSCLGLIRRKLVA